MRIAIPVWNNRVSPVFDVARSIRVVDIADGAVAHVSNHDLKDDHRVATLAKLGVDLLICAAISIPLESTVWVSGAEVISDTCGNVEEIIEAFSSGDRTLKRFRSPGNTRCRRSPPEVSQQQRLDARFSR